MNYKEAGVDVEAGYKAVELMKEHVKTTYNDGVVNDIGGFGGLYSLAKFSMEEPVLVSGTDGVGTKLKMAFEMDQHNTIGIDCVAMCVNDIICAGAKPLFFLDYIACGKNYPEKIATIVEGIATGCRQSGAALIGGETAEMPGFYSRDEYDMAGFAVGIVDKKNIIDGTKLKPGDQLIGIPSSGIHSNGYSLVRKIFGTDKKELDIYYDQLEMTLGEALLTPTKIYVKAITNLMEHIEIKAISHITGGGFIENIPRMMTESTAAKVYIGRWPIPPIFKLMEEKGSVSEEDMFNTFNMGIGMVVAVKEEDGQKALELLEAIGEKSYLLGTVVEGHKGIELCQE